MRALPAAGRPDRPTLDLTTRHRVVRGAIALATPLAAVTVGWAQRNETIAAVALVAVVVIYGRLSMIDAAEQRLPNRITLPLAAATAVVVTIAGLVGSDLWRPVSSVATGLAFAAVLLVLRFGLGDVKLALTVGTIAGWLGSDAVVVTLFVASFGGALTSAALIAVHRRRDLTFSYGPFLALGSIAGMIVAPH